MFVVSVACVSIWAVAYEIWGLFFNVLMVFAGSLLSVSEGDFSSVNR